MYGGTEYSKSGNNGNFYSTGSFITPSNESIARSIWISSRLGDDVISDFLYPSIPANLWCIIKEVTVNLLSFWGMIKTLPSDRLKRKNRFTLSFKLETNLAMVKKRGFSKKNYYRL